MRECTYIAMSSEMLQQLYLSQRTLGQDLLAEDIGDLLDRNPFLSLRIRSRTAISARQQMDPEKRSRNELSIPDNSISSLAKLLGHRVSLIDNEVLVEHLEHLSSLEVRHDARAGRDTEPERRIRHEAGAIAESERLITEQSR